MGEDDGREWRKRLKPLILKNYEIESGYQEYENFLKKEFVLKTLPLFTGYRHHREGCFDIIKR